MTSEQNARIVQENYCFKHWSLYKKSVSFLTN